jgi:cob(I)alamin adenosyltransferase
MKIYTKTGDTGETGLIDGSRVPKDHARVAAYGDVDELNAALGVVRTHAEDPALDALLAAVQRDLFALGAQLADPKERIAERKAKAAISAGRVRALERAIDRREAELPALRAFILPGGSRLGAFLHLARTVCRRAERSVVQLARGERVDPALIVYLNRLSDLLFVLARHASHRLGQPEDRW